MADARTTRAVRRRLGVAVLPLVLVLVIAACSGAKDRYEGAVPKQGANADVEQKQFKPGDPVPVACTSVGDFRLAQYVAQGLAPEVSAEERAGARQNLVDTGNAVKSNAPELTSPTERLVGFVTAVMDGKSDPGAFAGQPETPQDADALILRYQKQNCPAEEWGGTKPKVIEDAVVANQNNSGGAPASPGGTSPAGAPTNGSDPPPWTRTYIDPKPYPDDEQAVKMRAACFGEPEHSLQQSKSTGPTIAVIGDSAANVIRPIAIQDTLYHWVFASHCGERFGTVLETKRLDDALSVKPDVLVIFLGSNNTTESWGIRPDLMDKAMVDQKRLLDATDVAKCRVIVDLPAVPHPDLGNIGGPADSPEGAQLRIKLTNQINDGLRAAAKRPGAHLAPFAAAVEKEPRKYVWDMIHPTPAGINLWINMVIEAAQPCFAPAPPAPQNVVALVGSDATVVAWDPPTSGAGPFTYVVERSDGRTQRTDQPTATFAEPAVLDAKGDPVRFRVRSVGTGGSAMSDPGPWVEVQDTVTPPARIATAIVLMVLGFGVALLVLIRFPRVRRARDIRRLILLAAGLALGAAGCVLIGAAVAGAVAIAVLVASTIWYAVGGSSSSPPPSESEGVDRDDDPEADTPVETVLFS